MAGIEAAALQSARQGSGRTANANPSRCGLPIIRSRGPLSRRSEGQPGLGDLAFDAAVMAAVRPKSGHGTGVAHRVGKTIRRREEAFLPDFPERITADTCIPIRMRTRRYSKYLEVAMSFVLSRKPRLADSRSGAAAVRLGGPRREPAGFNDRWSDALAIGSLGAIIGIVVLLFLTR